MLFVLLRFWCFDFKELTLGAIVRLNSRGLINYSACFTAYNSDSVRLYISVLLR